MEEALDLSFDRLLMMNTVSYGGALSKERVVLRVVRILGSRAQIPLLAQ